MQEKENDKVKEKAAAAKKKHDPVATHKVEWANVSFTVAGVEYEYALPYLIDNPEFACVYKQKCRREFLH